MGINAFSGNEPAAIILMAGSSERMGGAKAFLNYTPDESFLVHLINVYLSLPVSRLILVVNPENCREAVKVVSAFSDHEKILIIENNQPGSGRFFSIRLGADALNIHQSAFIQNIDNPFTGKKLLMDMLSMLKPEKWVVPVHNKVRGHPVLLSAEILQWIRAMRFDANTNLREVLKEFSAIELLTDEEKIHANINTEEEYRKFFSNEKVH